MPKKIYFFNLVFIFTISFFGQSSSTILIVDLKQETNDSISLDFSSMRTNLKPFSTGSILKKKVIERSKGIPVNDSISYYIFVEEGIQASYDWYKAKELDKAKFLKFISERNIDTLSLSQTPIQQGFISIIGFYKNKQFLIADSNRNNDFSDDIKYEFSIKFRENPSDSLDILNKLPVIENYSYQSHVKGKVQTYYRKFILYPNKEQPQSIDKKEIEYSAMFRLKDYWKGEKNIGNETFEFYYQSRDNVRGALYIKPKGIQFSKKDEAYNNQFVYDTSADTVSIANAYYVVDSINRSISKIYLKKIKENRKRFGKEKGSYIKDFELKDLNSKPFSTEAIIKKKKYTLIEFWGTWCDPCMQMTPKLIAAEKRYREKLSVIGIARDDDIRDVKKYVAKKKINWTNAFVDRGKNNFILKKLNIFEFPTFILIDSNGKIIHRGGTNSFDEMLTLIQ